MTKSIATKIAIVFSFFLIANSLLVAQEPLRVGVVLSGGGAKGYAHVGALKVLEAAGVRIDYIGGASMGAIVGGLYASGWSAAKLDSVLSQTDMNQLLQDGVPRELVPLFEKLYGEKYALSLSVKDAKPALPLAYSDGQLVYNLLHQLTRNVSDVEDFSLLPIPFFCTGTDVSTGESIVFDRGSLALSMRASGSFPGLLAPVEINNRLIADGGIVNNFPAKELKSRGVDIVIGVNVEEGLLGRNELNSIEKLVTQIGSFQMTQNSESQLPICDMLICPDVAGFGLTDFFAADSLIGRGEMAAREVWEQLLDIAARQKAAPAPPQRPHYQVGEFWQIDSAFVVKHASFSRSSVLKNFPCEVPGKMSSADLYQGIVNMYGTGNFQFIDYQVKKTGDGRQVLEIRPSIRPGYERRIRAGLHYDDKYRSSLLLNGTALNLGLKNSITSLDIILGDKFRYNFYYFLDRGARADFGFNSRLNLNGFNFELPERIQLPDSVNIEELVFDFVDFSNELYTHVSATNAHAFGFSGELKFYTFSTSQVDGNLGNETFFDEKGIYLTGAAFYKQDNRDRRYFPKRGTWTQLYARAILPVAVIAGDKASAGKLGYNLDLSFNGVTPLSERLTGGFSALAGITLGEPAPPYRYYLGGNNLNLINNFKPFTGLDFASLAAVNIGAATFYGQYRVLKNHYFTLSASAAFLDQAFDSNDLLIYSGGFGYGLNTGLGPIELTYGLSNKGSSFYFNLGYWF